MSVADMKRRWRDGEVTYGVTTRLGSPWVVEVLAESGLDFIKFDLAARLAPVDGTLALLQAMRRSQAISLVKVPDLDPSLIGLVLGWGADGIVVPTVNTGKEAELAAAACRYPPEGIRSHGGARLDYMCGGAEREVLCIAMIESELGANNAREITGTEGIDGVTIGVGDLALSMGLPARPGIVQPGRHEELVREIQEACTDSGIPCGAMGNPKEKKERGFQIIVVGSDTSLFESSLKEALAARL